MMLNRDPELKLAPPCQTETTCQRRKGDSGAPRAVLAVLTLCTFVLIACHKKPDLKQEVTELERAFPAAANAAPPSEPQQTAVASTANAYVNVALAAVRTNDYAGSVIALQTVQRLPGVSAQQLMAIERTKQAMTAELLSRAERGDAKAKADLAAIEKTLSQ